MTYKAHVGLDWSLKNNKKGQRLTGRKMGPKTQLASSHWHAERLKSPQQVCVPIKHNHKWPLVRKCSCLLSAPRILSRRLLSSLWWLRFTSPLSSVLVSCVIHSHVHRLSPISCLINKTYLCACSLTSPSSRLVPKAKSWAHAELIKQNRLMAFSNCWKMTTIQAIARRRELCL